MFMLDPLYLLMVGPAFLLALWAQFKVKSAFSHFSQVGIRRGYTGAEAAQEVLDASEVRGVRIEMTQGFLSDHYDPMSRVLRLSPDVFHGRSIASVGVAAHEAGHAIQHSRAYAFLHVRSLLVPLAQFGSPLGMIFIVIGGLLGFMGFIKLGIILFSGIVLFQLITLPVEFDASARAKRVLAETGIIVGQEEAEGVNSVLSAAAMTYVAAAISSIMTLLYFLIRFGIIGGRRDD